MSTISYQAQQRGVAPTIYADAAYGHALTSGTDASWTLVADSRNKWQVPLIFRPILDGGQEASSPYGYAGIYADPSLSNDEIAEYWQHTVRLLRKSDVVSLFLRFPSFKYPGQPISAFQTLQNLELDLVSKTIEVATPSPEDAWSGLTGRARTATRKALRQGMSAEVSRASEFNVGPNTAFRNLYSSTMTRIGASGHHIYDDSYYSTLLNKLADKTYVADVTTADGKPAASAIILLDNSVVHYHLSGSDPEAARNGANNLLLWTILEWAATQGFESVHLGGGLLPGDSLYKFKESFGGAARDFWVGRAVIDSPKYSELAQRRAASLGTTVSQLASSGYFPMFRAEP